jgi:hypothetical protein
MIPASNKRVGRSKVSSFFAMAVLQSTFGVALAQLNPRQAEQQRQAQQRADQQRRVEAGRRDALEQAERRVARAQAEQQRKVQERAEQQRRAESNVARTLEKERREEERRALILRRQKTQLLQNQPAESAAGSPVTSLEARSQPPSSEASKSEFHELPWRPIGIGLMSSGVFLALGRLMYLRFFNRSQA